MRVPLMQIYDKSAGVNLASLTTHLAVRTLIASCTLKTLEQLNKRKGYETALATCTDKPRASWLTPSKTFPTVSPTPLPSPFGKPPLQHNPVPRHSHPLPHRATLPLIQTTHWTTHDLLHAPTTQSLEPRKLFYSVITITKLRNSPFPDGYSIN